MSYAETYTPNAISPTADDIEARLMGVAFNSVKEAAIAKGRDTQYTDNDTKIALAIRKMLDEVIGMADDANQALPLAVRDQAPVSPVIDRVYNMLDKELSEQTEIRQPTVLGVGLKKGSKHQIAPTE